MTRLVTVSNRVEIPKDARSAGGLTVGVLAALREHGGVWFGGNSKSERDDGRIRRTESDGIEFVTIDIKKQDYEAYYNGFSNNTLWPLFHSLLGFFSYSRAEYASYRAVNRRFAEGLVPLLEPDDVIWVHDYHLLPLAIELRKAGVTQPIGFFLHVPFPAFDVLRALPCHGEMLKAIAAYDVVGVQTHRDLWCLLDCLKQPEVGGAVLADGRVEACGRRFVADTFPIGIDVDECRSLAETNLANVRVQRLANKLDRRKLIIGIDRLDYSKGLALRFRAVETLLESYPRTHGQVVYMQIAPPTRSAVRAYKEIRHELERATGNINGRYTDIDWVPIRYLNRAYDRGVVLALMRTARVGLVTPIRDGMNLVAKEYLASQDPDDPGVLVLSRLCGAADELGLAVLINPYDQQAVADGIAAALEMPLEERRERHQKMLATLARNDVHRWSRRFMEALKNVRT